MRRKLGLIIVVLILAACGSTTTEADTESRFTKLDENLFVTKDTVTGCKYIVYREGYAGGVTPLMKANGEQDCE